mmetsp:Transcript_3216/g.9968  ORF Transcript_3216/g.9968 Transcript_3216/m.9968 type:complete len:249 (-) Transcript_3216:2342-3088(-)
MRLDPRRGRELASGPVVVGEQRRQRRPFPAAAAASAAGPDRLPPQSSLACRTREAALEQPDRTLGRIQLDVHKLEGGSRETVLLGRRTNHESRRRPEDRRRRHARCLEVLTPARDSSQPQRRDLAILVRQGAQRLGLGEGHYDQVTVFLPRDRVHGSYCSRQAVECEVPVARAKVVERRVAPEVQDIQQVDGLVSVERAALIEVQRLERALDRADIVLVERHLTAVIQARARRRLPLEDADHVFEPPL